MGFYMKIVLVLLSITFQLCLTQNTISPEEYKRRIDLLYPKPEARTNLTTPRPTFITTKGCQAGMECTPKHLCNPNGTVIIDGSTGFTERFTSIPECPSFEVCCKFDDQVSVTTDVVSTTESTKSQISATPGKCGFRNEDGVGYRVINAGEVAQFGEFPWIVAIMHQVDGQNVLKCGGSLIHPSVVITGAHCVQNIPLSSLLVRAGEYDTQTTSELFVHQEGVIMDIVMHPNFFRKTLIFDIAILFFVEPFVLTEHIQPICLPSANMNFDKERCLAAGWGKDKFEKEGIYSAPLKVVDLPIVPRDTCQEQLRTRPEVGKHFNLHETFVCAGGEPQKDTCKGDGGSPLMCESAGHYFLYGMVAWGIGCGNPIPAGYVNVPYFRSWLDEELEKRNISNTFYTP